jgi:hypothetical protein
MHKYFGKNFTYFVSIDRDARKRFELRKIHRWKYNAISLIINHIRLMFCKERLRDKWDYEDEL